MAGSHPEKRTSNALPPYFSVLLRKWSYMEQVLCCIPKQEGPKFKASLKRREEGSDGGREKREVRTKERMIEGREGTGGGEREREEIGAGEVAQKLKMLARAGVQLPASS